MTRKQAPLTPLELEIMKILWDLQSANVQDVQSRVSGGSLAYTTVQTMLNILHRKGKATRVLKGRAYFYRPKVGRMDSISQAVGDLIDRMFGGSAEELVMGLVETNRLTADSLKELQRKIAEKSQ